MTRFDDIKSKFEYVESLRQNLFELLFQAKKEKTETKSIMHHARTILTDCRECYDYCVQDIFETFVLPNTTDKKMLTNYKAGKLKAYFPLYESQLKKPVFIELKKFNTDLYDHLIDLANKIKNNDEIPKTLYKYGSVIELKDMVNEKKHDKLLAVKNDSNQEVLIEHPEFKAIMSVKKNTHMNTLHVSAGSTVQMVDEFLFEYNKVEVSQFCMTALFVTRIILNEIYSQFFRESFINNT